MREVDFLPAWYPRALGKRRLVALQSWLTLGVVCVLGLWVAIAQRSVHARQAQLALLNCQLSSTDANLQQLDALLARKQQWQGKQQTLARLGLHVEATRLLSKLAEVMPAAMAIESLDADVVDQPPSPAASAAARAAAAAAGSASRDATPDRRLLVTLQGVCPTNEALANLYAGLSALPYVDDLTMKYARDRGAEGRLMREFEIAFSIPLTGPTID